MQRHAGKPGRGSAVISQCCIDPPRATPETPFGIISDGRSLVLTPVRNPEEEQKFDKAVAMIYEWFGNAMKKLPQ